MNVKAVKAGQTQVRTIGDLTNIDPDPSVNLRGIGQFSEPFTFSWASGNGPLRAQDATGGLQHDGQPQNLNTVGHGFAFDVPAEAFEPEPAVRSAVIVVEPFAADDRLPTPADEDALWRLVQAAFRERRKMIHNVLSRQLPVEPATIGAALEAAGIAPDRRPQTVGVGEWLKLLEALGDVGPDRRGRRAGDEPER